jgi:hypothetical protein
LPATCIEATPSSVAAPGAATEATDAEARQAAVIIEGSVGFMNGSVDWKMVCMANPFGQQKKESEEKATSLFFGMFPVNVRNPIHSDF